MVLKLRSLFDDCLKSGHIKYYNWDDERDILEYETNTKNDMLYNVYISNKVTHYNYFSIMYREATKRGWRIKIKIITLLNNLMSQVIELLIKQNIYSFRVAVIQSKQGCIKKEYELHFLDDEVLPYMDEITREANSLNIKFATRRNSDGKLILFAMGRIH